MSNILSFLMYTMHMHTLLALLHPLGPSFSQRPKRQVVETSKVSHLRSDASQLCRGGTSRTCHLQACQSPNDEGSGDDYNQN